MCVSCHRVVGLETRDHSRIFCSHCQVVCPTLVVDCFSDTQWMWCPRSERREEISQDAPRSVVPNWFLHGPLSTIGRLYGWGQSPISSRQRFSVMAFLSKPLISLAPNVSVTFLCIPQDLGLPSRTCNVISGTRRRLRSFIHLYSDHFQSLAPDSEVARVLQSGWSGGQHLPANVQEMCSLPHIMSVL